MALHQISYNRAAVSAFKKKKIYANISGKLRNDSNILSEEKSGGCVSPNNLYHVIIISRLLGAKRRFSHDSTESI